VLTDAILAHDFRNGNNIAFVTLYNRYKLAVYTFALKMLNNPDEAKDIVQNVFLKVYERRTQLVEPERFRAWIFTIARNDCLTLFRQSKTRASLDDDESILMHNDPPLSGLVQEEETAIVRTAIGMLQPHYREIIILREYDNLSYQEIADVTDSTESIVKSRLFTARQILCKTLKPILCERKQS
jgi:RNA polymerase sigma-70 factor, ECF subfamily